MAGIYTVSLTVTNAYGTATKSKTGFISAGVPPKADFTASTRAGAIPLIGEVHRCLEGRADGLVLGLR